jgi:hypothetical protein
MLRDVCLQILSPGVRIPSAAASAAPSSCLVMQLKPGPFGGRTNLQPLRDRAYLKFAASAIHGESYR